MNDKIEYIRLGINLLALNITYGIIEIYIVNDSDVKQLSETFCSMFGFIFE